MAARGRKAEVDLVEVVDAEDLARDDVRAGKPPRPRGWRRIQRAWPIALVAVVVAGAYLVSGLRESAALTALQDVLRGQDGFVANPRPELTPLWSADWTAVRRFPAVVGETLLLLDESDVLVARDVATGVELWRAADGATYCGTRSEVGGVELVGCRVARHERAVLGTPEAVTVEIQLRDVRTGEVRASRDVTQAADAVTWRDAILLVESDVSGTRVRLEGFDGAERWSLSLFDDQLAEDEHLGLRLAGDRGIVTRHDRSVVVDLDANGPRAYELAGRPELLGLDDGSAGDVLLWRVGEGVVLADRTTGEPVYRIDRPVEGTPFVLDGALLHSTFGRLRAEDLAAGEERWSIPSSGWFVASDGVVVVAHEQDVSGSWLRALALDSGRELWRMELAEPGATVLVGGGALYVHDAGTFARLGR